MSAWRSHPTTNIYFAGRVLDLLEEAGLSEVSALRSRLYSVGGELDARRICTSFQVLRESDLISQTERVELQKVPSDPSFGYITATYFAAWGKRAS